MERLTKDRFETYLYRHGFTPSLNGKKRSGLYYGPGVNVILGISGDITVFTDERALRVQSFERAQNVINRLLEEQS